MLFYPFDLFIFINNNITLISRPEFISNTIEPIFFGKYFWWPARVLRNKREFCFLIEVITRMTIFEKDGIPDINSFTSDI